MLWLREKRGRGRKLRYLAVGWRRIGRWKSNSLYDRWRLSVKYDRWGKEERGGWCTESIFYSRFWGKCWGSGCPVSVTQASRACPPWVSVHLTVGFTSSYYCLSNFFCINFFFLPQTKQGIADTWWTTNRH
jgi:hypothetical protein